MCLELFPDYAGSRLSAVGYGCAKTAHYAAGQKPSRRRHANVLNLLEHCERFRFRPRVTFVEQISCTGSLASTLGNLNPFRYRGYGYDEETGWYFLSNRYYNPEVDRYLSADTLSSTGQGVLGYNMYAYCLNNPTTNYDPSGSLSFSNLLSGAKLLSVGLTAVAVGLTVLTCGAAAPVMVAVAAVTVTTGAVTVANGLAEVQEGLTASSEGAQDGTNFMRDGLMQGNKEAYECQRDVIATVAEVGTFICTAYTGLKGGVCFVAGTLVLTETGQEPIETITEGEAEIVEAAAQGAEIATELNAQELTLMAHEPENMEAAFTIIGERRKTLVPGFLFFRVSIITRFKKPHMYNRKRNFWVCMS